MSSVFADFSSAILILAPIIVLLRQYQLTHSKDYLIFALGFISILFEILLDAVFRINSIPNLEKYEYSDNIYVILQKIRYINFVVPGTAFYFVGKRARYLKIIDRKSITLLGWLFVILIFILQMELGSIPIKSTFIFFTLNSTIDTQLEGVIFSTNFIILGQGYEFLLILYQSFCIGYLAYSFARLENSYDYHKFTRIRILWAFTLSFFILGNIFKIIQILDDSFFSTSQIDMVQFLSFILIAIISISYPEGLLLSKIQIGRVMKLYKHVVDDNEEIGSSVTSRFLSKPMEYLRHVEAYYDENEAPK